MTIFLIFIFLGFFALLLVSLCILFALVGDRSSLREICICLLGVLLIAVPTVALAWNIWQRIMPYP